MFLYVGIAVALVNSLIGLVVFLTNTTRSQNRQFFILAISISFWALFSTLGFSATTANGFLINIRSACFSSVWMPFTLFLLFLSVKHPYKNLLELLKQNIILLAVVGFIAYLFTTKLFLMDVIMPDQAQSPSKHPEGINGPGFLFLNLYFPITFGYVIWRFVKEAKRASGIQKNEYQFILLGMATFVALAIFSSVVIPAITGKNQGQKYGPFAILLLDAIIAYGIATKKLMDVASILQIALSYCLLISYLSLLYIGSFFLCTWLIPETENSYLQNVPHFISAIIIAFSMAPANGMLQKLSNLLNINRSRNDIKYMLQESSSMLQSVSRLEDLLRNFNNFIEQTVNANSVRVYLLKNDLFTEITSYVNDKPTHVKKSSSLITLLNKASKPIATDTLDRFQPSPTLMKAKEQMISLDAKLAIPIIGNEEIKGFILLGEKLSGRIYTGAEQEALQILCNQFVVALENAKLYTQVQDSQVYNELLLDNMLNGFIAADVEGRLNVCNKEAQNILNIAEVDIRVGQPIAQLPEPIPEIFYDTLEREKEVREMEVEITRHGAEVTPLRVSSSIIRDHEGAPLGVLLVLHDLTMLKKLEEQLRRSDRLASIGTLAAGMAHEIKNPLVSLKTFTQLLPDRYEDEDFRTTFSSLVGNEVGRIDKIVNQLLHFARPAKPSFREISIHETLDKTLSLIENEFKKKDIELIYKPLAENDSVYADDEQLHQVFLNFMLNAIDAMERGGTLTVSTRSIFNQFSPAGTDPETPELLVGIQDTGSGISDEDLKHIFDPFFTTKSSGTGLGLAISHGIIEEHKGHVGVKSSLGKGTQFNLFFPNLNNEVAA